MQKLLNDYFNEAFNAFWEMPALADYQGVSYSYADVARGIKKNHILFAEAGIEKGDKISLIGKNSANWAISFLSVISYGAVVVPILPDFKPKDVHSIINHSDSKILFSSKSIFNSLDMNEMNALLAVVSVDDFQILSDRHQEVNRIAGKLDELFEKKYPGGLKRDDLEFAECKGSDLADISYTSGTTGFSKGVMLNHNSLASNILYARENMPLSKGDRIVSFLPLAHAYGLAFEFLFPFTLGCSITFLTKTPSPQIITRAFQEIKPRLILSVPLVIEKIFKKKIKPVIEKPLIALMFKIPGLKKIIQKKVLKGLSEGFGGNFTEVVVGGAALNESIEKFFKEIGFPFTVGYGMTECGPLISYAPWREMRIGSCGRVVDGMEVSIDSEEGTKIVGEILVRGRQVMDGYYKNPQETARAIDQDGWLHTGDLGLLDEDGFIYIKGRSKNMLLGPSGQNIYPEELESILNSRSYIAESLVIQEDNKLVALVYPDAALVQAHKTDEQTLQKIFDKYRKQLNEHVPAYMQISKIRIHNEDFVKTPKQSIKRYLYTK